MLIYLIRHGQTQANIDGICSGHTETPLTQLGILQAQAAKTVLEGVRFDHIYSSDLSRAYDTAKYITGSDQIITTPLLRERNYHNYEGVHGSILDQAAIDEGFMSTIHFVEQGGNRKSNNIVESNQEMLQRREAFTIEQIANHTTESISLIVSHGSFIRSIIAHILQLDLSIGGMNHYITPLQNTGICIISYTPDKGFRLVTYNQHTHILNLQ